MTDIQGTSEQATQQTHEQPHRKGVIGYSILSRIPFIRSSSSENTPVSHDGNQDDEADRRSSSLQASSRSLGISSPLQQSRTRRRKGSLRKVALLGRGAQRDKRDTSPLTIDTSYAPQQPSSGPDSTQVTPKASEAPRENDPARHSFDLTPRAPTSVYAHANHSVSETQLSSPNQDATPTYNSTTDEEDMLQMLHGLPSLKPALPMTSGPESYFGNIISATRPRRRSFQQAKSPLSYSGIASTSLDPSSTEWDYSETEWWGWVVLTVTWFVFVTGMGSCLGVWSWAWDVGKTPYAPPELEDDPTLPIVGYYPALLLLTCVMAWVWVVVAWVGMKYFRHAKISGD